MLDFDLAELYETETKFLKRAVKRNIDRFPEDFMFELTKEELAIRAQIAAIDGQINDAKRNTWKGKVTSWAHRTIDRLTRQCVRGQNSREGI